METEDDLAVYLSAVRACQCPISELNLEHEVLSSWYSYESSIQVLSP